MGGKSDLKIAVVMPVYNEGLRVIDTTKSVLEKIKKNDVVVLIDDGSGDESLNLMESKFSGDRRVYILNHVINLGKGAAMKTGMEFAWDLGVSGVVFIDSDGQHNPKHLSKFESLLEKYPVVFGYRQLNKKMPWIRKTGNLLALKLVGGLFGIKRRDLLCGFMAIRKSAYKKILWTSCRYGVETEIATRVAKNKISFFETKVDTIYLDKYKGVTILDALKILINIPLWFFK